MNFSSIGLRTSAWALVGALVTMGSASAQTVVSAASEIAFTAKQLGVPLEGKFRRWTAQVQFDPKAAANGKIAFNIDMGSGTLGVAETDAELIKADWFNTAKFPQATFQSTALKAAGKGRMDVTGQLTIKGQTQVITVPVALTQQGTGAQLQTVATGAFPIKRLAFKIGDGAWTDTSLVADDVSVRFKITLTGISPL